MTCLFFHGGYLACDSNHVLPGVRNESFVSPTKVVKFDEPLPLHLRKTDDWELYGSAIDFSILQDINDRIHGYTVTGSTTHAEKFIADWQAARKWRYDALSKRSAPANPAGDNPTEEERKALEHDVLLNAFMRNHHAFHALGLNADEMCYSLLLIGEKAVYRYRPEAEGSKAFDSVDYAKSHMYGSGCEYVHEGYRLYHSHALAIFSTMLMDAGTAGFVEVWKLPSDENPELYREAVWNPRTKEQIRELLKKGEEPVPDLISPKAARVLAQQYFDAGAFLGRIPNALEKHRKMVKEDPALGEEAVRLFGDDSDPKRVELRNAFLNDWEEKGWVLRPLTDEELRVKRREQAARKKAKKRKAARLAAKKTTVRPFHSRKSK